MATTTTTAPTAVAAFEVGSTYEAVSACDSDCIWTLEVLSRTAKFVTLRDVQSGETNRVGVRSYGGEEWASPFGTYSMAPVIRAGR
jgi:hypothetical protein